jgi:hypothetical protein
MRSFPKEALLRATALVIATAVLFLPATAPGQESAPLVPIAGADGDTINSFFPLWKSLLKGRKFMPPRGITVVMVDLSGEWDVQSFSASVNGNELASVSGSANVHPFTYGGRADVWVLPFVNVFATAGGLKMDVQASGQDLPLGLSGIPPRPIRGDVVIDLDFTGYYGGAGAVASGVWRKAFASVDYSTVWTHLESQQTGVEGKQLRTDTASVRIGYVAGAIQPYVGGRWVKKISHFEGTSSGPGGQPVTFAVDLQAPKWNYEVGIHALIARRFEIMVEAGFGKRTHGIVNAGYRF